MKWYHASLFSLILVGSTFVSARTVTISKIHVEQGQTNYQKYITKRQVVSQLIEDALVAFKAPERVSHAGFTGKLANNMERVADYLLRAVELEPYRADLLFSAASAYIYNGNVGKAVELYKRILIIAPEDIDAYTYLIAWNRMLGNSLLTQEYFNTLSHLSPERAKRLTHLFETIDKVSQKKLIDKLTDQQITELRGNTAIVVLGYVLNDDGSMNPILYQRLEKTLEVAKQIPSALIVLTGGVPKNHQTEAHLMAEWLVQKSINPKLIYQDNYARTTVENMLFSRYALTRHAIKNVILISSGSHVRRGEVLLTVATQESGPKELKIQSVSALDKTLKELQPFTQKEAIAIYRDSLKAMGLWSFRSYPLEER